MSASTNCTNCVFYVKGMCRRYPPTPIAIVFERSTEFPDTEIVTEVEPRYPEVSEDDLCGEWREVSV
jgi:hypothetical protein